MRQSREFNSSSVRCNAPYPWYTGQESNHYFLHYYLKGASMIRCSLRRTLLLLILGAWLPVQAMETAEAVVKVGEAPDIIQADICVICQENMALAPHIQARQLLQEAHQDRCDLDRQYEQRMQCLASICSDLNIDLTLREAAQAELTQEEETHRRSSRKREEAQSLVQEISLHAIEHLLGEMEEQHKRRMSELTLASENLTTPEHARENARAEIIAVTAQYERVARYVNNRQEPILSEAATIEFLNDPVIRPHFISASGALLQQTILQQAQEIILECGHRHHITCLRGFIKSQRIVMEQPVAFCPTCRGQISEKIKEKLSLELTADDILSFFVRQLSALLTQELIDSLRYHVVPLLENPQTIMDLEQISSHTKEEIEELICKLMLLLKLLSLDSVRTGDFQSLIAQNFPRSLSEN